MESTENKKIVWLASYPKSGNTWFRLFLTALLNNGELNINEIKTNGIFSSREIFERFTDLDSTYLYEEEAKKMQGLVFNEMADFNSSDHLFVKVHDAYTFDGDGAPVVPDTCTRCAIYFIRNPLDIVGSMASHIDGSYDDVIKMLNDEHAHLNPQKNDLNIADQLIIPLHDWSRHVKSWTDHPPFPVMVLRYEDMLSDTYNVFRKAVDFIGLKAESSQIEHAISVSSFKQLQQAETETGFRERVKTNKFFRQGKAGGWKTELNEIQVQEIVNRHREMMVHYDYLS